MPACVLSTWSIQSNCMGIGCEENCDGNSAVLYILKPCGRSYTKSTRSRAQPT